MAQKTLGPLGSLLIVLALATGLEANQTVLPGSIAISGVGTATKPAAAFNSVDKTWLVVWREDDPPGSSVGLILGRIVREDRTVLTNPFVITGGLSIGEPRVAHDPLRNEWMVVVIAGGSPFEPPNPFFLGVYAVKVTAAGEVLPTRQISEGNRDAAFPDVCAARFEQNSFPFGATPFFFVVWRQNVAGNFGILGLKLFDDPTEQSRVGFNTAPFQIDVGDALPVSRESTRPRLSQLAPLGLPSFGSRLNSETHPRVVFESFTSGGAANASVYFAEVNLARTLAVVKVAETNFFTARPQIAWNATTGRTLVAYSSNQSGSDIKARLIGPTPNAPHELLGDEFTILAGSPSSGQAVVSLAAQAGSDIFFASTSNASGNFGLGCIAGRRVVGTPGAGASNGFSVALSADHLGSGFQQPSTVGKVLLAFLRQDPAGTLIRASILVEPPPTIPNNPPIARAGSDLQVVEGTLFSLDGSASSDPNGDPLAFQWSRTGAGNPDDFFVNPAERAKEKPQLQAPSLGPAATPITLTYELKVDDFRSNPAFPAADSVAVRVVPGADANPPVARAGADRTVNEQVAVQLDGSASSDADGDALTFRWTLDAVVPPVVTPGDVAITGSNTAQPSFTTPRFANQGGIDLRFKLVVTTARGGRDEDVVVVHVRDSINEPPIADARGPATVDEGTPFQLDGTASRDPNGDSLFFKWELISTLSFNGNIRETVDIQGELTATPTITASIFEERDLRFRLRVQDNRPSGSLQDADEVTVRVKTTPMGFSSITPFRGSPGTRVTINGSNLADPGLRVFFGPEDLIHTARIVSMTDTKVVVLVPGGGPSRLRVPEIPTKLRGAIFTDFHDITTAPITIKKGNERLVTPGSFVVSHVEITEAYLSQGVENYPLIQGKATVLHVRVRTKEGAPAPLAELSSATGTAIPTDGTPFEIVGTVPAVALAPTATVTQMDQAVNFFLDASQTLAPSFRFNLHLFNNGIDVAALTTQTESATFTETTSPRILVAHVVPFKDGSVDPTWTDADQTAHQVKVDAAFAAFARIYPFSSFSQQANVAYYPNALELSEIIQDDGKIHLEEFGFTEDFLLHQIEAFMALAATLDIYNASHPETGAQFVTGMVAERLYSHDGTVGIAVPPKGMMADIIKFYIDKVPVVNEVLEFVFGLFEDAVCTATLGLFCEDPVDILVTLILSTIGGSLLLETTGTVTIVIALDDAGDTLGQEVGHNMGFVNPFDPGHDGNNIAHSIFNEKSGLFFTSAPFTSGPILNPVKGEADLFYGLFNRAKSVMSYAPSKTNQNCFLEPNHYKRIFDVFRTDVPHGGGVGAGAIEGPALRVSGVYSFRTGEFHLGEARPALPAEAVTPELPLSPLTIAFLNGGGAVLAKKGLPFSLQVPIHRHEDGGPDGDSGDFYAFFRAVEEIPDGTARAELRFRDQVLWTRSALGSAPHLELLSPTGGEDVAPEAELRVRWLSVDVDGDELTHNVFYSMDGGATFTPLAVQVRGTEIRWTTAAAQGSDRAVVKVAASDGFHSTEVVSGEFRLGGGKPSAAILSPAAGAMPVSSRPIALSGLGHAPGGAAVTDDGAYAWSSSVAGPLGTGRSLFAGPLAAGAHRLRLEVTVGDDTASAEVEVTVLPDRDGDGVDDATETAAGLNPDDPEDVYRDEDGDGLATGPEVLTFHSDPNNPDTDGDGVTDGKEGDMGTSPTQRDTDGDLVTDNDDNCPISPNAEQTDTDGDGIGDACDAETVPPEVLFRRGDVNGDRTVNITDAVGLLSHLFTGGVAPVCEDAADANDDARINISDALTILNFLFTGGATPPAPGPTTCGDDPTPDALERCAYPPAACL